MIIHATRPRETLALTVKEAPEGVLFQIAGQSFLLTAEDAYALCDAITDRLEGS